MKSRLAYTWLNNTPLKHVSLKAKHVIAAVIQKPSEITISKDYLKDIETLL